MKWNTTDKKSSSAIFTNNDATIAKNSSAGSSWNLSAIGDKVVNNFKVKIDSIGNYGDLMVGFTDGTSLNYNSSNYNGNGQYCFYGLVYLLLFFSIDSYFII